MKRCCPYTVYVHVLSTFPSNVSQLHVLLSYLQLHMSCSSYIIICVARRVTQFINLYSETYVFRGYVMFEDYPPLEKYCNLVCSQMFRRGIRFSLVCHSLSHYCQELSLFQKLRNLRM
jgi:hypothetical protein